MGWLGLDLPAFAGAGGGVCWEVSYRRAWVLWGLALLGGGSPGAFAPLHTCSYPPRPQTASPTECSQASWLPMHLPSQRYLRETKDHPS